MRRKKAPRVAGPFVKEDCSLPCDQVNTYKFVSDGHDASLECRSSCTRVQYDGFAGLHLFEGVVAERICYRCHHLTVWLSQCHGCCADPMAVRCKDAA